MPGFSIRWGQNAGTLDGPALQRLIPLKIHLSLPSFPLLWCQPTTLQRCILWFGVCVCVSAHSNFCPTEGSLLLWPAPCHKNLFGDPLPLHPEAQASGNDQQSCPASPKCLAHSECRFSQGSQITALIHHKKQPLGHKLFQEKNKFSIFAGGGDAGEGYVEQRTLAQPSRAKVLELAQEILQMPVRAEDWAAPQLGKIAGLFVFLYGSWHLHNWLGWRGHGVGGASGAAGSMPAQLQLGLASDPA